ncbi:hypothetical protein TA3x_003373 [Tundrisphaera sp. TA3]|uniref:hypothetical protein n=1 Tax=Tundrisphaera sp. TA3 TaxID=3435775 RepID=UPI003EBFCECD
MRTPMRAAFRLALTGSLGLALLSTAATPGRAAADPEKALPDSTLLFFKIKNVAELRESFKSTEFGRLLADPAVKPLKESVLEKLEEASKDVKAKLGVTLKELAELPQGTVSVAVVGTTKPESKIPVALLVSADAGKNASTMTDVMMKSTKQAEEAGAKVATSDFKGLTLHIIQAPKEGDKPAPPPVVWTNAGSVFHISTDVDALQDVITNANGRSNSLASVESYAKVVAKLGEAPVSWFLDITKSVKAGVKAAQANGGGQSPEAMIQLLGLDGLKAAAGTFTFNSGPYDSISKIFVMSPAPAKGLLKLFSMPPANLRPEPWVPATVASYQTFSWDLDAAYAGLNDLVNQFQPGMLDLLQQQLVGPNGGEPLNLQKDIFGPLGDRMTLISDFKKPIKEDSQRLLFGIALEDAKAFQNTLNKIIALTGGSPAKREFQGATIFDFKLPEMPNPNGAANNPFKSGVASLTIAKDTLFVSTEPALLEGVLRGGASSLVDNPEFQAISKQIPAKTSSLSFARSEEQARLSYDMIKSGQFEQALKQANANNPDAEKVAKAIDKDKIPPFEVFAKYLSQGGGFGIQEDDGMTFTNFTLRKSANP